MAGKGGKIAPDGRAPQAPGVGKDSRRHDLEAPATPGLHGTDLQQGDVQAMEQSQQIAPRPKKQMAKAQSQPRKQGSQRQPQGDGSSPDALEFAKGRIGGSEFSASGGSERRVDPSPWIPLLEKLAMSPSSGGALASNLTNILATYRRKPIVSSSTLIDMEEIDETIARSL